MSGNDGRTHGKKASMPRRLFHFGRSQSQGTAQMDATSMDPTNVGIDNSDSARTAHTAEWAAHTQRQETWTSASTGTSSERTREASMSSSVYDDPSYQQPSRGWAHIRDASAGSTSQRSHSSSRPLISRGYSEGSALSGSPSSTHVRGSSNNTTMSSTSTTRDYAYPNAYGESGRDPFSDTAPWSRTELTDSPPPDAPPFLFSSSTTRSDSPVRSTPTPTSTLMMSPIHEADEHPPTPSTAQQPRGHRPAALLTGRPPKQHHKRDDSATSFASSLASTFTTTTNAPPTPSRARWHQIREQLLPSSASVISSTSTIEGKPAASRLRIPSTPTPPSLPSASGRSTPTTPRPSRLAAKLGFRQIVNEARVQASASSSSLAAERDTPEAAYARKFAEDVQAACWAARFVESSAHSHSGASSRHGTDISAFSTGSFIPTFMSTTSLPATAHNNSSTAALNILKPGTAKVPSLRQLHDVLLHYASTASAARAPTGLPHESEVLSALLVPFSHIGDARRTSEDEQALASEAFEVAVKTWPSRTSDGELERCVWCCKAVVAPSALRGRLFGILYSILFPRTRTFSLDAPLAVRTLVQALFTLLAAFENSVFSASSPIDSSAQDASFATFSSQITSTTAHQYNSFPATDQEIEFVRDLIQRVASGACGALAPEAVEDEYGVPAGEDEDWDAVHRLVVLEGLTRCMENGDEERRRWMLRHAVDEHWPEPDPFATPTPLTIRIAVRKTHNFLRAAAALLSSPVSSSSRHDADARAIARILRTRVIPEIEAVPMPTLEKEKETLESRARCVRVLLELAAVGETVQEAGAALVDWLREGREWKKGCEEAVRRLVAEEEWKDVVLLLTALIKRLEEQEDVIEPMVAFLLPLLNDRIVMQPPDMPCQPLTDLLDYLSQRFPKLFYKPLFACAASTKEVAIANHLAVLVALTRFLPDFWIRDTEMMCVAIMSDAGGAKRVADTAPGADGTLPWGAPRLGQSVLITELVGRIRATRTALSHDTVSSTQDQSYRAMSKFAMVLESRLGILLDPREKQKLVPQSQRVLLVSLFLEIRLLTRSLKPSTWLTRVLSWTLFLLGDQRAEDDIQDHLEKLEEIYQQAQQRSRAANQRRSTILVSPRISLKFSVGGDDNPVISALADRIKLIMEIVRSPTLPFIEILVALSGLLSAHDYANLGPSIWNAFLLTDDVKLVAPMCFLINQCAEKSPEAILSTITADMQSPESSTRDLAVQKLAALSSLRFQVLSQTVIVDRNHPRPFKFTRPQMSFVATDIGSSLYVRDEELDEGKDGDGTTLPLELRKRLSEIGWEHEGKIVDPKVERAKTPVSLLPIREVDRIDDVTDSGHPPSPTATSEIPSKAPGSPGGGLLRRKSSTGSFQGVKKRAVFVPSLGRALPHLAAMTTDSDFAIASCARAVILDMMRDDPILLGRPAFDILGGEERDVAAAISTIRKYMHVQETLPPAMAHHVFNNLTGFLRFARQTQQMDSLQGYAYSLSVLAKLANQVSDMSVRELRRAKVDAFFIPTGALWFSAQSPEGPMFPRNLSKTDGSSSAVPPSLIWITLVRVSQNMFFLAMLKRKPQDVQVVRKSLSRLELPSLDETSTSPPLELADFVPVKQNWMRDNNLPLAALSLVLSRSYLLLIAQLFRCMSRHLSDRNELAVHVDGINRILLAHGHDIGIVGQAMVALMVATTRFRRLFTSRGAYALFMPAVIKVYTECESHSASSGIREAIEYAISRFYAFHEESFVFQSIDAMANIIALPRADASWIATNIYMLFSTLKNNAIDVTPVAAGIRDLNKAQEKEALLLNAAEDIPQTVLANLRRGGTHGEVTAVGDLYEHEEKKLGLGNFVRLFLTVIAHDPTILRAERFLRLLRYLAPSLYNATSTARNILRDGIEALGLIILTRAAAKAKVPELAQLRPGGDRSVEIFSQDAPIDDILGVKHMAPSDLSVMRLDYLALVIAFVQPGGDISSLAFQRTVEIIKTILRDPSKLSRARVEEFLADFCRISLFPPQGKDKPTAKRVVSFLGQIKSLATSHMAVLDLHKLYHVLVDLVSDVTYVDDLLFCRVVTQFCAAALDAYAYSADEHLISDLMSQALVQLIYTMIPITKVDVLAELEKHESSHGVLTKIVLPLVMKMKCVADADSVQPDKVWNHNPYQRAWVRLLAYAIAVCEDTGGVSDLSRSGSFGQGGERTKTQEKRSRYPRDGLVITKIVAIQIVQIIVVRAQTELSDLLPGIWNRLGQLLRAWLVEGDASFALAPHNHSPIPSPAQSPTRKNFPLSPTSPAGDRRFSVDVRISTDTKSGSALPRVIDFLTWSLLEIICLHRTPLMIQMRSFMQERVVRLDQQLRAQENDSFAFLPSPRSGRRVSTTFAKPRRPSVASGASSPRTSMHIPSPAASPAHPASTPPHLSIGAPLRRPGYDLPSPTGLSPNAPPPRAGPKIVHLGPVRQNSGSTSQGFDNREGTARRRLAAMLKSAKVTSPSLVRRTYARVRLVQETLGYTSLVPAYDEQQEQVNMPEIKAMSRTQAVRSIIEDIQALLEEFEMKDFADDMVIVDVEPSKMPSTVPQGF